jgi:hypothetical protein
VILVCTSREPVSELETVIIKNIGHLISNVSIKKLRAFVNPLRGLDALMGVISTIIFPLRGKYFLEHCRCSTIVERQSSEL